MPQAKSQILETNSSSTPLGEPESMEFYLYYIGPLPTENDSVVATKHAVRKAIHTQLAELWSGKELADLHSRQEAGKPGYVENLFSAGFFGH